MSVSPVKKPSAISYFNAVLLPFVYFFSRKRMAAGTVSLIVCFFSIPMMLFFVGVFSYFAMSVWATRNLRSELKRPQSGRLFFYVRRGCNLRYDIMGLQVNGQARAITEKTAAVPGGKTPDLGS